MSDPTPAEPDSTPASAADDGQSYPADEPIADTPVADPPVTDERASQEPAGAGTLEKASLSDVAGYVNGVTDETLLEHYRNGDESAFSQLVERYQRELFHFLIRFLGSRASAEDVFQETFLQIHQSAEQFDLARRFRPWMFTIAANKARDLLRSQSRRPTSPLQASVGGDEGGGEFIDLMAAMTEMPDAHLQKEELEQQVRHAVGAMPEHLREILLLSYFNGFPYKQISDILGIPLGTVKSRLHAAVAHFADRWRAVHGSKSGHPMNRFSETREPGGVSGVATSGA